MATISLVGSLGRDPEIKYLESGKVFTSFSIAERADKDKTNWFDCVVWGSLGEKVVFQYCKKGSKIFVSGDINIDTWEKDGEKKSKPKITVSKVTLLNSKDSDNNPPQETYLKTKPNEIYTDADDIAF